MKAPPDYGRIDLRFNPRKRRFVPESAGDKLRHCEERSDEAVQSCLRRWIASRSLSSSAHSRDPLARNDEGLPPATEPASAAPTIARSGLSPSGRPRYPSER